MDIESPEARALIAESVKGNSFDADGLTRAARIVQKLFLQGVLTNRCPRDCGGCG